MNEAGEPEATVAQNLIRLLGTEDASDNAHDATQAAERVFEAMRIRLSLVLGAGGFSTLLARSLTLSRPAFPWLTQIVPDKFGSVAGRLEAVSREQIASEVTSGFASVLTRFTDLLTTFIGADLTDRLLTAVFNDLEDGAAYRMRGDNNL